jgi:hypothetical protein
VSPAFRIAHLRPQTIRALVVREGAVSEEQVATDAASLRRLVGGTYSFLYLAGGFGDRGVVLVCNVGALHALSLRHAPTAGTIARALGTTVAVGPAKLRDGSTAWTSLTDGEVEFWRVALAAPPPKRRKKGGTP